MKTPRQVLLQQHQSVEPKLDAIRGRALARLPTRQSAREFGAPGIREMLFSLRWHLAAMGGVWVVVVLLNIDHSPTFTATIDPNNIPSPQRLLAEIRENRRQVLELLELPVSVRRSEPPRRRSELPSHRVLA